MIKGPVEVWLEAGQYLLEQVVRTEHREVYVGVALDGEAAGWAGFVDVSKVLQPSDDELGLPGHPKA